MSPVNICSYLDSSSIFLQITLFMYAKATASSWLAHACKSEAEVLEKRELRGTYLVSEARNRREFYSTPTFYSEKSICMTPSCSETINQNDIADHLDLFRLGSWISEIPIPFPLFMEQQCLLLPDSNTSPLDNGRGNRSRGIIFFTFFTRIFSWICFKKFINWNIDFCDLNK